jgi:hypothetical protein
MAKNKKNSEAEPNSRSGVEYIIIIVAGVLFATEIHGLLNYETHLQERQNSGTGGSFTKGICMAHKKHML